MPVILSTTILCTKIWTYVRDYIHLQRGFTLIFQGLQRSVFIYGCRCYSNWVQVIPIPKLQHEIDVFKSSDTLFTIIYYKLTLVSGNATYSTSRSQDLNKRLR